MILIVCKDSITFLRLFLCILLHILLRPVFPPQIPNMHTFYCISAFYFHLLSYKIYRELHKENSEVWKPFVYFFNFIIFRFFLLSLLRVFFYQIIYLLFLLDVATGWYKNDCFSYFLLFLAFQWGAREGRWAQTVAILIFSVVSCILTVSALKNLFYSSKTIVSC